MLSGFSKLFDKPFAVGFLLPVLLALASVAWLYPKFPVTAALHNLAATEDSVGKLLYVGLITYAIAILLTLVNIPIYRAIEGYGALGKLFPALQRRQDARRGRDLAKLDSLDRRWDSEGDDFPPADRLAFVDLKRRLLNYYPPASIPVLPTRFGNVLRAFESYPLEVYGADGVSVWPRLASVVSKEFAGSVEEARAQVDCLVNLGALAVVIGAPSLVLGALEADWSAPTHVIAQLQAHRLTGITHYLRPDARFWAGALMLACVYLLYLWAIERAVAWGELVKAAFDCYLPALAKQLGYALPDDEARRKLFWADIGGRFVYREAPQNGPWKIVDAAPADRPGPIDQLRDWLGRL